jgi:hypothetical protein
MIANWYKEEHGRELAKVPSCEKNAGAANTMA